MMTKKATRIDELKSLNKTIRPAINSFQPSENLPVDVHADTYRRLSEEASAEPGPWRTSRTPWLQRPMRVFSDPKVRRLICAAPSQTAKSELLLNIIASVINQTPATTVMLQPNLKIAKKFAELRIDPMIRDTKCLRKKVRKGKGGDKLLQKSFPGGKLILVGTETAADLAMIPAKILLGDERDRHARSAEREGDPWELAVARQTTYCDAKSAEVSSPTTKGDSNIEDAFYLGTQEYYQTECPDCGEYHCIGFNDIKFDFDTKKSPNGKKVYTVTSVCYVCPHCGCQNTEKTMKSQPSKWVAQNPDAYKEDGCVSFWFNPFVVPWYNRGWKKIVKKFLEVRENPLKYQVFVNTWLGQLWEDRSDVTNEDELLNRLEDYGAELPEGVLALTCGVDTQDDRLEYEILGHGFYGEEWHINTGVIPGRPDTDAPWDKLDEIIDRVYKFKNGKGLKIIITLVDSGGHYTQDVYKQCAKRLHKRVFAIKGKGGEGTPFINPPKRIPLKDNKKITCWLYGIGVDAGKAAIMASLKVQEPGANYTHFPKDRGYDANYFRSLLSEKLVLVTTRTSKKWMWEKLPGHRQNEKLDCTNYARAGIKIADPDFDAIFQRLKEIAQPKRGTTIQQPRIQSRVKKNKYLEGDGW